MTGSGTDLEAPLLGNKDAQLGGCDDGCNECHCDDIDLAKNESPPIPDEAEVRLKGLSFGTGVCAGLVSQVILSVVLWEHGIMRKPTTDVVLFSFVWSILTCFLVNTAMMFFVRDMEASYCPLDCPEATWSNLSIRMECWLIGGALLSIAGWWLALNIFGIILPLSNEAGMELMIGATTSFVVFFALTSPRGRGASRSSSAWVKNSIASLTGFLCGICSQFIMGHVISSGVFAFNSLGNIACFALAWSGGTVLITLGGCLSLRLCKPRTQEESDAKEAERIFLRMESFYILCCMIGISFAWISLDTALGLTHLTIPSMLMLLVSALIFRAILYNFPEEKCLEEEPTANEGYDDESNQGEQ